MSVIRVLNLALSFFLELGMLAALAYWGVMAGGEVWASVALGIAAPVVVSIFWGTFMAPKARRRLRGPWYTVVALLLFGVATVALYAAGQKELAGAFGALVVLNQILRLVFERRSSSGSPID